MADGWASALGVMGGQAGLAMARAHDLPVRWVLDDGEERISPALARMIAQ